MLARLLWGLSYERHPDTLIVVDRPFLDPTPFEGETSDPFVLVPSELTPLSEAAARALRRALPLRTPSQGTVRWHTPGLDLALTDTKAWHEQHWRHVRERNLITRRGGLLVFAAPPVELRAWALAAAELNAHAYRGMDYAYLDNHWPTNGEVQIFRHYRAMVSSAVTARQEILATTGRPPSEQSVRELIWHRSTEVRQRRVRPPGKPGR